MQNAKPLKIEIERNLVSNNNYPFTITINGKQLENVKRFSINLDRDLIYEKQKDDEHHIVVRPWTYEIEFEDDYV